MAVSRRRNAEKEAICDAVVAFGPACGEELEDSSKFDTFRFLMFAPDKFLTKI